MEYDNPVIWGITIVFWGGITFMIWKASLLAKAEHLLMPKIVMTILLLPIIFFIANYQVNKG